MQPQRWDWTKNKEVAEVEIKDRASRTTGSQKPWERKVQRIALWFFSIVTLIYIIVGIFQRLS